MAGLLGRRLVFRVELVLLTVTAVGLAVMGVYVTRVLEQHAVEQLRSGLVTSAHLIRDALPASEPGALPALTARYAGIVEARVTVMAPDGTVLADSAHDPETMENHGERPEVRIARTGVIGSDVRRTVELGAALAVAIALGVGVFLTRRVTWPVSRMRDTAQRMAEGDLDQRVPIAGHDEVAELGHALNRMAHALQEKVQALESQRSEIAAILERMVEGVIALDHRARIVVINPAARRILGLTAPPAGSGTLPVEGRPLAEVVREKALFDLVDACRAGAAPEQCRGEIELPPPVARILRVHAVALAFPDQAPGTLLVLHDVTELRRLERVRTEFVGNVSHELRTPLTAIKGYLETLLDGALDDREPARRFLETAHRHADRLGRLVDDLLELSDVESGRVRLDVGPVSVHDVAGTVAAMFEAAAGQKHLTLLNAVPDDVRVQADADRLSQILVNLVDNALKYTAEGGQVTLTASRADRMVEISVEDTGIGIPAGDLPRISERFYRVDRARSRALGGTGLGLAIVKHLVHAHGGALQIDSELGKGTTVRFTLPAG
jgi:two-component system phosphate regulon sensor histidine kinase PhoR